MSFLFVQNECLQDFHIILLRKEEKTSYEQKFFSLFYFYAIAENRSEDAENIWNYRQEPNQKTSTHSISIL